MFLSLLQWQLVLEGYNNYLRLVHDKPFLHVLKISTWWQVVAGELELNHECNLVHWSPEDFESKLQVRLPFFLYYFLIRVFSDWELYLDNVGNSTDFLLARTFTSLDAGILLWEMRLNQFEIAKYAGFC